jgi:predicted double-glycine peptidase
MNIKDIFSDNHLVIQDTSYDCGPASLLNVLHLKKDLTHNEAELTALCGAHPRVGTSHEHMAKVAKKIGLEVVDEKQNASMRDIEKNIDAHAYVIVNYFEPFGRDGHYAVVTEYDDRAIYLRDSWFGLLRLDKEDFTRFWFSSDHIKGWYLALR